jgi:hypothetical protein
MMRSLTYAGLMVSLLGVGFVVGRAQAAAPNFELVVDAPGGQTSVRCVRGCALTWVERGVNPNEKPTDEFRFSCTGSRCSSGRIGGWSKP